MELLSKKFNSVKYSIIFAAAVIIEIASTFYIMAVSHQNVLGMIFWAFAGPFLNLPFIAYQIEAKTWHQRFMLAAVYGFGYAVGAILVLWIKNSLDSL